MNSWPPPDQHAPLPPPVVQPWHVARPVAQPWQLPPQPPSSTRSRTRWLGLAIPVVLLLVVFAASIERRPESPFPASWDPRVTDLVEFVERERELAFFHPVEVTFLSSEDFDAGLDGFDPSFGNDENAAAVYDVLGLADDYDPQAATSEGASRLLGYFDGIGITVRGDELTLAVQSVIVHELTHALQAQHFDFSELYGDIGLALIEGDAVRIENRWVMALDEDEQRAVHEELYGDDLGADEAADEGADEGAVDDGALPWTLGELQSQPYVVGPPFLEVLEAEGGTDAIDAAFRSLPSEEQLYDPWQYLNSNPLAYVPPLELEAPAGTDLLQPMTPLSLFEALVIFDTWLPWQDARRALDPWRDGATVAFRRADATCVTVALRMDSRDDTDRVMELVTDWAAASGSDAVAEISSDDSLRRVVTFTSCDRSGTSIPEMPLITPSWALAYENQFVSELIESAPDIDRKITRCAARRLVDDPALAALITDDEGSDATWEAYVDAADALLADCEDDRRAQAER